MNLPTAQTTPPPLTVKRPAAQRIDPPTAAADLQQNTTSDRSAVLFPLGRPAIPLPVEAYLPYREPASGVAALQPTLGSTQKLQDALAVVSAGQSHTKTLDILVPAPTA